MSLDQALLDGALEMQKLVGKDDAVLASPLFSSVAHPASDTLPLVIVLPCMGVSIPPTGAIWSGLMKFPET